MTTEEHATTLRPRARRCEAHARRGTGTGVCDTALDEHGICPRADEHLGEE